MSKNLGDAELLILLNSRYGTKTTVQYYLKKAVDAARRAKVDLAGERDKSFVANAQEAFLNMEMVYKVLGDDSNVLEETTKKS